MDRSYSSIRLHHHRHRRENPSFSSSLLDSIYRSIDGEEDEVTAERELIYYRETMRKNPRAASDDHETANFRRSCLIENWMEKKSAEKGVSVRRSSTADYDAARPRRSHVVALMNSNSTSSESSSGGGFSSSESDRATNRRPKPIRTSFSAPPPDNPRLFGSHGQSASQKPGKRESGFVKTKSRALKIYGDLKKVKQPISPGGKLASFLNSIFTKPKPSSGAGAGAGNATTCSSASSFSRSCLSNTPSSRGKFSEGSAKRSVRFCPVNVIVDEDFRTIGHKRDEEDHRDPYDRRRVQEVAIDLLKGYQRKSTTKKDVEMSDVASYRKNDVNGFQNDDEDEDDDDAASYSSSDLFELDNFERYREELPVYETTHFNTNRAIANGFIL